MILINIITIFDTTRRDITAETLTRCQKVVKVNSKILFVKNAMLMSSLQDYYVMESLVLVTFAMMSSSISTI